VKINRAKIISGLDTLNCSINWERGAVCELRRCRSIPRLTLSPIEQDEQQTCRKQTRTPNGKLNR
jgi:hypothetical protein